MPEWLARAAPGQLAVFLRGASPRKSGLFLRHLCRCFPELFSDSRGLAALDAADRYEAGELDEPALWAAIRAAQEASAEAQARYAGQGADAGRQSWGGALAAHLAQAVASRGYYPAVLSDLRRAVLDHAGAGGGPRKNPTARAMRPVFLEHFGDPHHPAELDPAWLTSDVVALARGIYDERAFDRMPILADALQDAGCDNDDILSHCRGLGPHVRGCWVVDLLLGKS